MLLCNAALFEPGGYATSPDGLELVKGLLDELETGAPARVVLQSSHAEKFGGLDFDNLKGNKFKESGMSSYSCAKLWMLMFGEELQRQGPRAAQIDVFVVQPGLTDSPLMDKADTKTHLNAAFIVMQNALIGMPTWLGTLPALYALTETSLSGKGFQYIGPNWFNLHMLGLHTPGNSLWHTGGIELRSRLFEETISLLKDLGHQPACVAQVAVVAH
ncbi:hypothetical protein Vafri_1190 [Volvox africanus]|nr:hypothetical protein Vafri_1190 [Volvox africanus]